MVPPLFEPQFAGMSTLALGLGGYEEVRTAAGIAFYRQAWWRRMR